LICTCYENRSKAYSSSCRLLEVQQYKISLFRLLKVAYPQGNQF